MRVGWIAVLLAVLAFFIALALAPTDDVTSYPPPTGGAGNVQTHP